MSEQELARALQELIARQQSGLPDPRELTAEILRRDPWRVRLLAGLSVLFWLVAAAGLILLVVALDRLVVYIRTADVLQSRGAAEVHAGQAHPLPPVRLEMLHGTSLLHHSVPLVVGSVGALLLAAVFTVLLVFSSRRTTLRQINISLMALSEQVRQLRQQANAGEGRQRGGG
jgi:hypothetical protein